MKTFYDLVGIGSQATLVQIEQDYKLNLDTLKNPGRSGSNEQDNIRLQAIKDAYLVLSSPARRQAYDAKLTASQLPTYEVVESAGPPWTATLLLIAAVLGGSACYYNGKVQEKARRDGQRIHDQNLQADARAQPA